MMPTFATRKLTGSKPDLVGRDRELAKFDVILEQHQPGLIIVSGEAGMGKTSLLREVRVRAVERGWKTVPGDPEEELSVAPDTTEDTFCNRVRKLLPISVDEGFSETVPAFDDGDIPGKTETRKSDDSGMSRRISVGADQSIEEWTNPSQPLSETLFERRADTRDQLPNQPRRRRLHPLVEQLRRPRVSVLLFIDGYRPGANFANWFIGHFIRDVKRSEAPVVVVVADQPNDVSMLKSFADLYVFLRRLDSQSIRQLLETIGQQMTPPMEAAELEDYVKEVCKKPELLGRLIRVLQLAQPATL